MSGISFFIPGRPTGKERPRMTRSGFVYTPARTRHYEDEVGECFQKTGNKPLEGMLEVTIEARFAIPKSYTKAHREECSKHLYYGHKPDADNIQKAILDGMNGIAYRDDSQVVEVSCCKKYADDSHPEGCTVTIRQLVR